jgi:2,3-bisphosphoglycerate-independent phosphoglycerate mutase
MQPLKKTNNFRRAQGPVVLTILDGVGIGTCREGNAIGCGRVFDQGAKLVNESIKSRALFEGVVWEELIQNVNSHKSRLHFIGLLSDGNVHSHIEHLEAMLKAAKDEGVKSAYVHILLDGRDVPPTSALDYVDRLENYLSDLLLNGDIEYAIASGGGRMQITMDRYQANWSMVELGWKTHVLGEGRKFGSAREAIEKLRAESPGVIDQDLGPFVIARNDKPMGPIVDNDSVIFYNFRGDRAIEISLAFEQDQFDKFPRGPRLNVKYAGMMQYDGDALIPQKYLVNPPGIDRTVGEYLVRSGVKQLAISETQKFGHL